jgi:hypothetical protein
MRIAVIFAIDGDLDARPEFGVERLVSSCACRTIRRATLSGPGGAAPAEPRHVRAGPRP